MHSPKSWVQYDESTDFPIENLPYGVFIRRVDGSLPSIGVAIGDYIMDLNMMQEKKYINSFPSNILNQPTLNALMGLGRELWLQLRRNLIQFLTIRPADLSQYNGNGFTNLPSSIFVLQSEVDMLVPAVIGDYTDFYSSKEHATNLGLMFRPNDQPLLPNWNWIPVGYHGRSSSIIPSGTNIHRPCGQVKPKNLVEPYFSATQRLDYELEMAAFVGSGNQQGSPIPIQEAENHIFGFVVMNDWSARDIQPWEYVPLGPFTAKNFATTISPWVVTLDALEPFRCPAPLQDPLPLSYLHDPDSSSASFDIQLEVKLTTESSPKPNILSRGNFRHMYWSIRQQLAHHTITGCNMRPGDLLASGTISGSTPDSYGSMIELSWNGTKSIDLHSGEKRMFIEDGDTITMVAFCQAPGYRIGFGSCSSKVLPALL